MYKETLAFGLLYYFIIFEGSEVHNIHVRAGQWEERDAIVKDKIKIKALELGFDLIGVAPVKYSPGDHNNLLRWLEKGNQGKLSYMERSPRQRYDPKMFFKDVKSIVVAGVSYYNNPEFSENRPYISIYARSQTYQKVIKRKLKELLNYIKELDPGVEGKAAVDTSPTSEKLLAQLAGIGWRGKHTIVINRKLGSFIFLGELFLNIELEPDEAETDHCADCVKCLEACPTGALEEARVFDANKCISYLTLEEEPEFINPAMIGNNIYGCDICQLVCPFNQKAKAGSMVEMRAQYTVPADRAFWENLTEDEFKTRFKGTSLEESGFKRIKSNAAMVIKNLDHVLNGS